MRTLIIISFIFPRFILIAQDSIVNSLINGEWVSIENYDDSTLTIQDTLAFIQWDTSMSEKLINNSYISFSPDREFRFRYDFEIISSQIESFDGGYAASNAQQSTQKSGQWYLDDKNTLTLVLKESNTVLKYYIFDLDETRLILTRIK